MDTGDPPELDAFLADFDAAVAAGVASGAGPLSSRLFGAADRVDEIRAGSDVGVRRLFRARETLAALVAQSAVSGSRRRAS
jgi:hypothetical protein